MVFFLIFNQMTQINSAILEVAPMMHNLDFAKIAEALGLEYKLVIGGKPLHMQQRRVRSKALRKGFCMYMYVSVCVCARHFLIFSPNHSSS